MNKEINKKAAEIFQRIKKQKPLVHQITNFVVMNDTANITLHIGALPVMAHAKEEVEEMTAMAGALVLNIGTLQADWVESMKLAGRKANSLGIPIILDPVGAGATSYRTKTSLELLQNLQISVLRGNSGEIGVLGGVRGEVKGVESIGDIKNPESVACELAKKYGCTVVISGKRDIIADLNNIYYVDNGHELLTTLTGTGCMATSIIGAFCAVEKDYSLAAASGLAVYGLAAELAAKKAKGPGSFKVAFFDAVYNLTTEEIIRGVRIVKAK
ncbi:hydroxyethylthiazole kinase [Patescibacteria group bacterium]|nr:hydroxyethylthiazole kinase [Patescibacteria group bacterium]MBU4099201.1 hydroxyethylthiazole kinase [Patescibacteria group bacterium]